MSSTGGFYVSDRFRPDYILPQAPMKLKKYEPRPLVKREMKAIYKERQPNKPFSYMEPRDKTEFD